jgi:hypothetical protein
MNRAEQTFKETKQRQHEFAGVQKQGSRWSLQPSMLLHCQQVTKTRITSTSSTWLCASNRHAGWYVKNVYCCC